MSTIKSISDYPEISFISNYTLAKLQTEMLTWFQDKYKEVTGKSVTLSTADTRRLILSACAYYLFHGYEMVDRAGKMNLLKYSTGDFLENLGALKGVSRMEAAGATATIRYTLKTSRSSATAIPAGSRTTAGDGIYFATNEYAEIPAGSYSVDVEATSTTTGEATNNYAVGEINRMVDVVPYIDTVTNTTEPVNGRDIESDDDLRERIFLAPEGYTTGGSLDAYKYHVYQFDPTIEDVSITSPSTNTVQIVPLCKNGAYPSDEYITLLKNYISKDNIKMLTDVVNVIAPTKYEYTLNVTYYINSSDSATADVLQKNVEAAIEEYVTWQKSKIGRDLNPSHLDHLIRAAGAKRAVITSPVFTVVGDTSVAALTSKTVTYGGLEDD